MTSSVSDATRVLDAWPEPHGQSIWAGPRKNKNEEDERRPPDHANNNNTRTTYSLFLPMCCVVVLFFYSGLFTFISVQRWKVGTVGRAAKRFEWNVMKTSCSRNDSHSTPRPTFVSAYARHTFSLRLLPLARVCNSRLANCRNLQQRTMECV